MKKAFAHSVKALFYTLFVRPAIREVKKTEVKKEKKKMQFVNFVFALSPLIVVLVGILGFKQPAKRVAPLALIWTLILGFTYFNVTGASFAQNITDFDALIWKD